MGCGLVRSDHNLTEAHVKKNSIYTGLVFRKDGMTPWDAGQAQPPLKELLESKVLDLPSTGSAFVPGCGTVCA